MLVRTLLHRLRLRQPALFNHHLNPYSQDLLLAWKSHTLSMVSEWVSQKKTRGFLSPGGFFKRDLLLSGGHPLYRYYTITHDESMSPILESLLTITH